MIGTLLNLCIGAGLLLIVVIVAWWAISKTPFGKALSETKVGEVLDEVLDTSQQWSAYASLTAIRYLDCVEADPEAVKACEYLRGVVTAWPKEEEKEE